MNDIKNKSVYLAAPKRLLDTDLYTRAHHYITELKPLGILTARGLFKNNKDWMKENEALLLACNVMIVVSDNAIVGKGVYVEYQHFRDRFCKVYHYFETGGIKSLIEIKKLQILDSDDWIDYAGIKYN